MAMTVVGLFDEREQAQNVVQELVDAGFRRDDISLVASNSGATTTSDGETTGDSESAAEGALSGAGTGAVIGGVGGLLVGLASLAIPGVGPIIAAGPLLSALTGASIGAAAGGLIGGLTSAGVSEEDAGYYAEGVRRGGTLVAIRAEDDRANEAADILDRNGAIDIDTRAAEWKQSTASSEASTASQPLVGSQTNTTTEKRTVEGEQKLPVVEEEMRVGKREVQRGGVRVYSEVTQRPVEEQVNLREEHVEVERRPVDATLSPDEADKLFTEEQIEMTERAEEAVVDKRARVVEEVSLRKDVEEHDETIRDTVRRKDVRVEEFETEGVASYDSDFEKNFRTRYANSGHTYEEFRPAYQYGSMLARDGRFSNSEWSRVEQEARTDWESRGQGPWEEMKDAVRYGWEKLRGDGPSRQPGARL